MKRVLFCCLCVSVIYISSFKNSAVKTQGRENLTTFYYSKTQEAYQQKLAQLYRRTYAATYVNGFQYTDTVRPFYFDTKIIAILKRSEADFSVPKEKPLPFPEKFI